MRNTLLKLLLLMTVLSMPLQVYGEGPKVVKAWLGVYNYSGTYYDPLGNEFNGNNSYPGPEYIYTVINYQLDNGEIIRQMIKITDNNGTSNPAATAVISWTDPDGNTHAIFNWSDPEDTLHSTLNNLTPLPYTAEIDVGSQIIIAMNDNYDDDNYDDGLWAINISENGISFSDSYQRGGYFHNLSFLFQNLNTSSTWEIFMPYKYSNREADDKNITRSGNTYVNYSGIIPFNGSSATIYDVSGYSPDADKTLSFDPPTPEFFGPPGGGLSIKVPIPFGAVIMAIGIMLFISYKRVE